MTWYLHHHIDKVRSRSQGKVGLGPAKDVKCYVRSRDRISAIGLLLVCSLLDVAEYARNVRFNLASINTAI